MITNRYYIITIIALFLSLSLGILIGGTLGQQWINSNQQKLFSYYEQKVERLSEEKDELLKLNKEIKANNEIIINDYQRLFNNSIADAIIGTKILWINDSDYSYKSLQETVKLAGGEIELLTNDRLVFNQEFNKNNLLTSDYDLILFFQNGKNSVQNYNSVLDYKIPVIYVTDEQDGLKGDFQKSKSLNEHYEFITFLKKIVTGE